MGSKAHSRFVQQAPRAATPDQARPGWNTASLALVSLTLIACSADDNPTSDPNGSAEPTASLAVDTTSPQSVTTATTASQPSTTSHLNTVNSDSNGPESVYTPADAGQTDSVGTNTPGAPNTSERDMLTSGTADTSKPNTSASIATSGNLSTSELEDAGASDPVDIANVCDESVPEDHYVDGIPAYAQCAESESAAIWSNDGINTSASQQTEWRRTQFGGGYQCTEFANRYLFFVWGVERVPNGDAGTWCDAEPPEGLVQSAIPVHGDLIVFAPGSCGASPETGHVAVVDTVDETSARVTIVEQNRAGRRTTDIECAACFLHAVVNERP